ncbi:hypothetical protein [Paenibacillus nasutitermitis]|uniref:Uncharacterized protein n=1 Tax=Paenibacillus nasutitermitis TaxID=1652958 RepID=A0A916ZDJ1_9BACL|nr:hypothetical protein [Paenibacillus nasutitermitis]GGD90116.1 hypothetical protein GCM10010911_55950 [Paenibacillus nasutitermitis]
MHKEKASIHGAFILVLAFFFFPVAYLLVLVRFMRHRHKSYMRARDYKVAGFAILLSTPMVTALIATAPDSEPDANGGGPLPFFFLMFVAILLLILSRASRLKIERIFEKYKQLIIVQRVTGIDQIAQAVGVHTEKVLNDLQYMVRAGLLPFAYIDRANRQVTMQRVQEPWDNPPIPPTPQNGQWGDQPFPPVPGGQQGAPSNPAPRSPVSVNCTGCGAASTILPGENKYCEFCGNVLPRNA